MTSDEKPLPLATFALITAATFTLSAPMIGLTRFGLSIASVWPANILAVLLGLHRREEPSWVAGAGVLLGSAAANLIWGDPGGLALGLGLANAAEVTLTLTLIRSQVGAPPWDLPQMLRALGLSLFTGPLAGAALGAATLAGMLGLPLLSSGLTWASASMVSALVLVPVAWMLQTAGEAPPTPRWLPPLLWLALGTSLVATAAAPELPLLFLPPMVVVYFAALGQVRQAMVALLLNSAAVLIDTSLDIGPLAPLAGRGDAIGVIILQLYLAASALVVLPVCVLIKRLQDTRDELAASELAALQASEAKGEFLATMSHELRTPVAAIVGFAHLLKDSPLNPTQRSYVERIETGSEHLQALVGDVLDLIRIEAGELTLEPKPFDLHALAYATSSLISGQLHAGVEIRTLIGGDVPVWVDASELRVRQVLMNLLGNAAKFTTVGSVMLQLRVPEEQPGRVEFIVRDTGSGIPPEQVTRIFDAPAPGALPGRGLGLRIVHKLAQAMGGAASLHSTVGIGTVVQVSLPMPAAEGGAAPGVEAEAPASTSQGLRVLIVDDDPVMGELVRIHLAHFGCDVVGCLDSETALAQLSKERFDMLMTDLHMPGMDGPTLIRVARGRDIAPPHLVLMTADATPQVPAIAERSGFHALLVKPVTQESLRRVMPGAEPALAPPQQLREVPDLDEDMLEELLSIMGRAEFSSMLARCFERFLSQLKDMEHVPVDRTFVQEFAHQVRGTAGNLALARVRQLAEEVETLVIEEQDYKSALAELRDALVSARGACVDAELLDAEAPKPQPKPKATPKLRLIKEEES
ncbi:MAG: response regulator [Alphaproteobacteria bacterium]|nr:response regulator [Alphaproteobacteria bacterium]